MRFIIFKHIPDIRRQEPKNVGVALIHPTGIHARFVGEGLPGEIDLRKVRPILSDTSAYAQWVDYWRYHVDQGNTEDSSKAPIAFQSLIDSSKNSYIVVPSGRILIPSANDKDPNTLLTYLYNELVEVEDEPSDEIKIDLERTSAQLVKSSGMNKLPLFLASPEIMVLNKRGVKERVNPSYLVINRNYNVMENVSLHMTSEASARKSLDATQYMYEKLEIHARKENNKPAVFVSFIDARPERYTYNIDEITTILQSWGPIVDVTAQDKSLDVLKHILAAK